MSKKLLIAVILLVGFISCESDEDVSQKFNGDYSGIFTVEYTNGRSFSNSVTVNFTENNNYISSGNGNNNDFYPAGGNGTYETTGTKITFYDSNIWSNDFDTNLVLSGEYDYEVNGNQLVISTNIDNIGVYKYDLTRE